MNCKILLWLFLISVIIVIDSKKISKSRSSGSNRGTSRKTNSPKPIPPTSHSYPQQNSKPILFGWQEKTAQKSSQPSSNQGHSYPSSNTGLSGYQPKQSQSPQSNNYPSQNSAGQSLQSYPSSNGLSGKPTSGQGYPLQSNAANHGSQQAPGQTAHSYPSSNGLSGKPNSGQGYPSQSNTPYSGAAPPPYSGQGYPSQSNSPFPGAAPPPYSGQNPSNSYRPYSGSNYANNNLGGHNYIQGQPPPYSNVPQYGGPYGHGSYMGGYSPQMPGYFGNYANKGYGGVSRSSNVLTGVGIAGAGVGTILTGLALWNLARSTGQHHHTVIYDNRGQPVAVAPNATTQETDSILKDLVNCTLTISSDNATEVLAIPCAIATSFTPDATVKDVEGNKKPNDNTKCIITVVTKESREYTTTIPCSILLNTAAENNVTESAIIANSTEVVNDTFNITSGQPAYLSQESSLMQADDSKQSNYDLIKCTPEPGNIRDPINPCFAVTQDLSVIPLRNQSMVTSPAT